jgi:hypothetical protein
MPTDWKRISALDGTLDGAVLDLMRIERALYGAVREEFEINAVPRDVLSSLETAAARLFTASAAIRDLAEAVLREHPAPEPPPDPGAQLAAASSHRPEGRDVR